MNESTLKVYKRICIREFGERCFTSILPKERVVEKISTALNPKASWGTNLPIHAAGKWYLREYHKLPEEEIKELMPKCVGVEGEYRDALLESELEIYNSECKLIKEPSRTILLLLPLTGLRIAEITAMRLSNIVKRQGIEGFQFRGKGSVPRFVPLNKKAKAILDSYIHAYEPVEYLFTGNLGNPISEGAVRKHTRKIGTVRPELKKLSPHILRHTFASMLLKKGVDLKTVQTLLGHKNIETTSRYLHPDAETLFKGVEDL